MDTDVIRFHPQMTQMGANVSGGCQDSNVAVRAAWCHSGDGTW